MGDELLKDHEIEFAWGRADFGDYWNSRKRSLIAQAVLKKMCGYAQGHTSAQIATELKLITKTRVTKLGQQFVWQELGSKL